MNKEKTEEVDVKREVEGGGCEGIDKGGSEVRNKGGEMKNEGSGMIKGADLMKKKLKRWNGKRRKKRS